MTTPSTADILNRVLVVQRRSLPTYLQDAAPWLQPGEVRAQKTLRSIARDQKLLAERLVELLTEADAPVESGEYPMVFTAYHDVSFDWLLPILIQRQQKTVDYLKRCADELTLAPLAKAVVEEAAGQALGHLHLLEELQHPPRTDDAAPTLAVHAADDHGAHSGHGAHAGHH